MDGPQEWGDAPVEESGPKSWGDTPVDTPAKGPDFSAIDTARGDPFAMSPAEPSEPSDAIPAAFLDRARRGQALDRIVREGAAGIPEGFGESNWMDSDLRHQMVEHGVLSDPMSARPSGIHMLADGVVDLTANGLDLLMRAANAGIHGAAGAFAQINEEFGADQGTVERARNEVINAGNWAMIEGGFGRFSRMKAPADPPPQRSGISINTAGHQEFDASSGPQSQPIGGLPRAEDFKTGAETLAEPGSTPVAGEAQTAAAPAASPTLVERNLRDLWEERGIHPAEAVHDAQNDAWLRQEIAPPSFTAFHASPHEFDAFDLSKIGTGEGTQQEGHGLYFAGSESVARGYRDAFTGPTPFDRFGKQMPTAPGDRTAISSMRESGFNYERAIESLGKQVGAEEEMASRYPLSVGRAAEGRRSIALLETWRADGVEFRSASHLYQVQINTGAERFLDLDAPLSQQNSVVRAAVEKVIAEASVPLEASHPDGGYIGAEALYALHARVGAQETARLLRNAGIPGTKYPSPEREARGTPNYVLFDPSLIQITHKNGVELKPTRMPPIINSPVPEGTPRSELAKTGEPHIDAVLNDPVTRRNIDSPVIDDTHDVPYSAGGSVPLQDPTVFIDRHFPRSLTIDGVTFDPADPFTVHENVEQHVMERLIKGGHRETVTGYHGTDKDIADMDVAFGGSRGGIPGEEGSVFFAARKELAGLYGKNVIQREISTGRAGTFDATALVNDPQFIEEMKKAHFETATRNDFLKERAKTTEGAARIEQSWQKQLEKFDAGSGSRNSLGQVRYNAVITSAIIKQARAQGLDVAIVKNMAEGHGPASDQYIVLNNAAFGMDAATAYSVAHHEFAEKAEGAWYAAHGIDQAKAEEAYRPFIDQIEHEKPANPPPNLYTKPYPHDDVRAAAEGESFTAFHGSPHEFDAFDLSKVGTGEGALSSHLIGDRGVGVYLAENPKEADSYAQLHDKPTPEEAMARLVAEGFEGDIDKAINLVSKRETAGSQNLEILNRWKEEGAAPKPKPVGFTYSALVRGAENRLLDFDKPVSEQSQFVQDALKKAGASGETGTDAWFSLGGGDDNFSATKKLESVGIKGTRYINDSKRFHNYVIFDPSLIDITHKNGEPVGGVPLPTPEDIARAKEILAGDRDTLTSGGADVTRPENLPSLAAQPAPRRGSLVAAARASLDKLFDMGRDIQMKVAPMAVGSKEAMASAKDFANAIRRNRWEWARIDQDIARRFTPEERKRMWDAADEESVARQLGESREHQGLVTLDPEARAAVEDLHARAEVAWAHARDLDMVEGDGLPAYTPRMVLNVALAGGDQRALPLNVIGRNLRTTTSQLLHRGNMMAEETEAAAQRLVRDRMEKAGAAPEDVEAAVAKVGIARDIRSLPLAIAKLEDAVAGRALINKIQEYGRNTGEETVTEGGAPAGSPHRWFTLDHPAFKRWTPDLALDPISGTMKARTDDAGNIIFKQVPLYVRDDFEGPLRAVLNETKGAQSFTGTAYGGLMALKGKTMSLIMNSPLIHNAVEWGRAIPAMPGKVMTFRVYFDGARAMRDTGQMLEAIDAGMVPIGKRFFNQDITSIMEEPSLAPGRSLTGKVLGFVPGLFDPAADTAVRAAIDKAGDFWHNTMLWDRIANLQMGLYTNFRDGMIAKGVDRQTATRAAAHWANRYAGALPQEAMSDSARKVSNLLMFSRSFTLGNLGVMKDMLTGLPRDVMAQIERDGGMLDPKATRSMAARKAVAIVAIDIGLMYVMNSLLQNVANVLANDSTANKEMHDYAERFQNEMQAVKEHPLKLLQPLSVIGSLSATAGNEPGKQDRIHVGNAADGTAIYARNPVGKIGEEFIGYMTGPLDMMRRKMGTIARPAWQIMSNDAGFGRKIYDPNADVPSRYIGNIAAIAGHLAKSQFPEGQIGAFADLVKGEGDPKVNALGAFGPIAGVTFSKGAPGGQAVGELYQARTEHQFAVDAALPDIRRQIQRGDVDGAQARMTELGIAPGLQRFYIKTSRDPATRLGAKTLRDFYRYGTPEQQRRLERAQQAAPAR